MAARFTQDMKKKNGRDNSSGEISLKQWGSIARFLISMHSTSKRDRCAQNRGHHRKSEIHVSSRIKDLGFLRSGVYHLIFNSQLKVHAWKLWLCCKHIPTLLLRMSYLCEAATSSSLSPAPHRASGPGLVGIKWTSQVTRCCSRL